MTRGSVTRAVRVTAVLMLLPAALFVAGAQFASADTGVAEERFSTGLAGPVGIVAVILGVGGLVAGLVRRRMLSAARAAAMLSAQQQPQPAPASSKTAA